VSRGEVVRGDFDDPTSLERWAAGADVMLVLEHPSPRDRRRRGGSPRDDAGRRREVLRRWLPGLQLVGRGRSTDRCALHGEQAVSRTGACTPLLHVSGRR